MSPRSAIIVTSYLLVALMFFGVAGFNVYRGQTANAVMQSVIAALVLSLGIGLARAA